MKKIRLKSILFFFLLCQMNQMAVGQIMIDVVGNWNYTIPTNDLTEAGLDFTGTYSSNANQVTVDISRQGNGNGNGNGNNNYRWQLDIRQVDVDWHPNLQLYARRTGDGIASSNAANITGGNSYQLISSSNQSFFSGRRNFSNIPIQYQIRNVSVLLPAKTYETTIIYTVTEL